MGFQIIDLSQEIYQGMPVFPMHQKTMIFPNITHQESLEKFGFMFATNNILINEHGPTHTDALYESNPNGTTIDKTELFHFVGSAVCLDVSQVSPDAFITPDVLERALSYSGQTLERQDIVLLYTGHYDRSYGKDEWLTRYTGLNQDAAEWLGKKGVINIGVDAPSIDKPDDMSYSGHLICQKYKMLNTENLCNLNLVANKRFMYIGLPLKIRKGSGSPVRAVALIAD